jgi:hypothetical protein
LRDVMEVARRWDSSWFSRRWVRAAARARWMGLLEGWRMEEEVRLEWAWGVERRVARRRERRWRRAVTV